MGLVRDPWRRHPGAWGGGWGQGFAWGGRGVLCSDPEEGLKSPPPPWTFPRHKKDPGPGVRGGVSSVVADGGRFAGDAMRRPGPWGRGAEGSAPECDTKVRKKGTAEGEKLCAGLDGCVLGGGSLSYCFTRGSVGEFKVEPTFHLRADFPKKGDRDRIPQ